MLFNFFIMTVFNTRRAWQEDFTHSFLFSRKIILKVWQTESVSRISKLLFQVWQKIIIKCDSYYKVRQNSLKSVTSITKHGCYYKMRRTTLVFNCKKDGRGFNLTQSPVVFPKICFSEKAWSPGFKWLLISS